MPEYQDPTPRDEALSQSDVSDDQDWSENEDDGELESLDVISLLDDRVFPDALSMISYCKEKHGFDFLAIRSRLQLDFYGTIKLINFIRQRVHEGAPLPEEISASDFEDDVYLKPVLDDDALILCLDDLPSPQATAAASGGAELSQDLARRNAELQAELEALAGQFNNYRLAVQQTLDKRWGADQQGDDASPAAAPAPAEMPKDDSAYYWESYAHNEIHETMLKDSVRTEAYRDFIYDNKHLFEGKVVLDVGCGTGILSMFCARAGAKQVIAVDNSDIVNKARENIFNNKLAETIVCLKGRVEDVVLPVQQVDIIVSEWMGYCLLYEAMLPSIIWARDRYLAPGGLLVPSHASLWLAPVSDAEYVDESVRFWREVYGFDMTAMQRGIYADVRVDMMRKDALAGPACAFRLLDLHTARVEDLVFDAEWRTEIARPGAAETEAAAQGGEGLDGFMVWFDIFFATSRADTTVAADVPAQEWAHAGGGGRVAFTTGPLGKETHWKQGVFLIDEANAGSQALRAGQEVRGRISFEIPKDHARGLDIKLTWETMGEKKREQSWRLH